jgi:pimeloyl-ACP methyl ester carboxylesterase
VSPVAGTVWAQQDQSTRFEVPWLPAGSTVVVPGRGEFFIRHHRHHDHTAPTVLLLHGWTASADLQYFTAYEALAERYSFIAIDHRGHGRGLRSPEVYRLEDAADDAAAVVRQLGVGPVIAAGYSMGGPISMLLTRRHRDLVTGLVVQATALEWRARLGDRLSWMWLPVLGAILRSWAFPRYLHRAIERVIPPGHSLAPYLDWITAEMRRGDPKNLIEAGRALKFYDARGWADALRLPAGMLLTKRDRLVRVSKQRALATALGARITEIDADHLCTLAVPAEYARAIVTVIDGVVAEIAAGPAAQPAHPAHPVHPAR